MRRGGIKDEAYYSCGGAGSAWTSAPSVSKACATLVSLGQVDITARENRKISIKEKFLEKKTRKRTKEKKTPHETFRESRDK